MARDALIALGLTPLEAEVYAALLQASPASGYRVAQLVGKPTANVYKAIASLAEKGAVLADRGQRQYRAVSAAEFIGRLTRELTASGEAAIRELSAPAAFQDDEGVYALRSAAQVEGKFNELLAKARDVILIDASPEQIRQRRAVIAAAARRKVVVAVKAYAPATIAGATVHIDPRAASIRKRWETEWLHVVADGSETLLASLGAGGKVRHAVWTPNRYLNVVYHEALASEIILADIATQIQKRASAETLTRLLQQDLRLVRLDRRAFAKLHMEAQP